MGAKTQNKTRLSLEEVRDEQEGGEEQPSLEPVRELLDHPPYTPAYHS